MTSWILLSLSCSATAISGPRSNVLKRLPHMELAQVQTAGSFRGRSETPAISVVSSIEVLRPSAYFRTTSNISEWRAGRESPHC